MAEFFYCNRRLSPGKINLFLEIEGRRPDGYHLLSTVMQAVAPADDVTLKIKRLDEVKQAPGLPQQGGKDALILTEPVDPPILSPGRPAVTINSSARFLELSRKLACSPENNLMTKAIVAFWSDFIDPFLPADGAPRWRVLQDLEKQVPAQAGLGGGSGNAAAVLCLLADYLRADQSLRHCFSIPVPSATELRRTAARLGADVPFFIEGGLAYCEGIGDRIKQLPPLPGYPLLFVQPDLPVSTAQAFRLWDEENGYSDLTGSRDRTGRCHKTLAAGLNPFAQSPLKNISTSATRSCAIQPLAALKAIREDRLSSLRQVGGNIFEHLIAPLGALVQAVGQLAYPAGADLVQLSGSGSAVYCIFKSEEERDALFHRFGSRTDFAGLTCRVWPGHFLNG